MRKKISHVILMMTQNSKTDFFKVLDSTRQYETKISGPRIDSQVTFDTDPEMKTQKTKKDFRLNV